MKSKNIYFGEGDSIELNTDEAFLSLNFSFDVRYFKNLINKNKINAINIAI